MGEVEKVSDSPEAENMPVGQLKQILIEDDEISKTENILIEIPKNLEKGHLSLQRYF